MFEWIEDDGVFEFRSMTEEEHAKQRDASESSDWVHEQLNWAGCLPTLAAASGAAPAGASTRPWQVSRA